MRPNDIAGSLVFAVLGRWVRRAIGAIFALLLAAVAVGFLTAAGFFALELNLGLLYAEIIVGAVYAVLAAGLFIGLVATRSRSPSTLLTAGSSVARNAQITMVVEALMLGYMLANKASRR